MDTDAGVTGATFVVRSNEADDPGRRALIAARDKIVLNQGPDVTLLRQWPDAAVPTRLLVSGNACVLFALLHEFLPAVRIETNCSVRVDLESDH